MEIDTDTPIPLAPTDAWQALPVRGAWLAALGGAALLFPFAFPAFFVARATDMVSPWLAVPVARASLSSTLRMICQGLAPIASAASSTPRGTSRRVCSTRRAK